jgi:membrane fusion protein
MSVAPLKEELLFVTLPLFRQEVLDAQGAQYLGSIRIGRNPRQASVAIVALLLAGALIAFAAWGQVTRKARIPGLLVSALGTLQLSATSAGTLVERRVSEGDFVPAGQVLFVLGTDRAGTQGNTAALVAQSLMQRRQTLETERGLRELQARQRLQALGDRLRAVTLETTQAQAEAEFAERRVALATKSAERYQELASKGFVSEVQAQVKQEELIDLQTRAQAAHRTVAALQREQGAQRAEQTATYTQLQTDLTQLDRSLAALAQDTTENDARRQLIVTAPQAGTITALHVPLGSALQAGQTLATLVPQAAEGEAETLQAELYAPSRTAGFVQAGQEVWLRYAAFPYQKFGMARATVANVSRTPVNPQELPQGQAQALMSAARANEPLYRIKVALANQQVAAFGQEQQLRPGMALEADVVQERRAVWEWVLEPVLALRKSASVY